MSRAPRPFRRTRRFARRQDGTATMEFVIAFPLVMLLFVAVFESGIILTRQVMLEASLDDAVRVLRLARNLEVTADDIEDAICDNTTAVPDCDNVLVIDLRVIEPPNYDLPPDDILCVDRTDLTVRPGNEFDQGRDNQLMLIRACAVIDRILPFSGFGLNLTRDDTGGLHMVSTSILVNEPD
jgi:hypothetical protein